MINASIYLNLSNVFTWKYFVLHEVYFRRQEMIDCRKNLFSVHYIHA